MADRTFFAEANPPLGRFGAIRGSLPSDPLTALMPHTACRIQAPAGARYDYRMGWFDLAGLLTTMMAGDTGPEPAGRRGDAPPAGAPSLDLHERPGWRG